MDLEANDDPLSISHELLELIDKVYGLTLVQDENADDFTLDMQAGLSSEEFKEYTEKASKLAKINVDALNNTQRAALLLNIYQCMYIHNFLRKIDEG